MFSGEMACSNWKVNKICTPKNQCFWCKTIKKLIVNFWRKICDDNTLSEHLSYHECNNIGTYKRDRCLFMMSNPGRCTDLFVAVFKLEGGWVGQNQSEHCSNLEICTEKLTIPNPLGTKSLRNPPYLDRLLYIRIVAYNDTCDDTPSTQQ